MSSHSIVTIAFFNSLVVNVKCENSDQFLHGSVDASESNDYKYLYSFGFGKIDR